MSQRGREARGIHAELACILREMIGEEVSRVFYCKQ